MKLKTILSAVAYAVAILGLVCLAALGSFVLWAHWRMYG